MLHKIIKKITPYKQLKAPESLEKPLLYLKHGSKKVQIDCNIDDADSLKSILQELFFTDIKILPHEFLQDSVTCYINCPDKASKVDIFTILHLYSQRHTCFINFKTDISLQSGMARRKKLLEKKK